MITINCLTSIGKKRELKANQNSQNETAIKSDMNEKMILRNELNQKATTATQN